MISWHVLTEMKPNYSLPTILSRKNLRSFWTTFHLVQLFGQMHTLRLFIIVEKTILQMI